MRTVIQYAFILAVVGLGLVASLTNDGSIIELFAIVLLTAFIAFKEVK